MLADGPKAMWDLTDAGDYPVDITGHGYNMDSKAVVGSLTYRQSVAPMGGWFSVNLARAGLARSASAPSAIVDNLTMEIWVRLNSSTQGDISLFGATDTSMPFTPATPSNGYWAGISGTTQKVLLHTANAGSGALSSSGGVALGTSGGGAVQGWHQVVFLRRAGTWELWIDGAQDTGIGTFVATPGVPPAIWLGGVGTSLDNINANFLLYAMYESALSGARIAAHYNAMIAWPDGDYPYLSFVHSGAGTQQPATGRVTIL